MQTATTEPSGGEMWSTSPYSSSIANPHATAKELRSTDLSFASDREGFSEKSSLDTSIDHSLLSDECCGDSSSDESDPSGSGVPLKPSPKTISLCGAGHVSHYLLCALTQRADVNIKLFAPYKQHGARLREIWARPDAELRMSGMLGECSADLDRVMVSDDPAEAFASECVIFALPPPAYFEYLKEVCLHARAGTVLLGLPGVGCFEWAVAAACTAVGRRMSDFTVAFTQECPLSCRIGAFGESVFVRGKKVNGIMVGCLPAGSEHTMAAWVEEMLLDKISVRPAPALQVALSTSIMIGHGFTLQACLQELDDEQRDLFEGELLWFGRESRNFLMDAADAEWRSVASSILDRCSRDVAMSPNMDLLSFFELWRSWYPEVSSCKTLAACLAENPAYRWTTVPAVSVEATDGSSRRLPNFRDRKFSGDVPFGLCLVKVLAVHAGVATPVFDECIAFLQEKMQKDYLRFPSSPAGFEVELGDDLKKECHFVPLLADEASLASFLRFYSCSTMRAH